MGIGSNIDSKWWNQITQERSPSFLGKCFKVQIIKYYISSERGNKSKCTIPLKLWKLYEKNYKESKETNWKWNSRKGTKILYKIIKKCKEELDKTQERQNLGKTLPIGIMLNVLIKGTYDMHI